MLTIELQDTQLRARLSAMTAAIRKSMLRAVTALAIRLVKRVQEKLSGEVLGERTHHLHDSIHYEVAQDGQSVVATIGTNVRYAAFWEFGYQGVEQVREHMRKMVQAFGRPVTPREIMVRAHQRKVDQPPRSFLRSTLREFETTIREELETAARAGAGGEGA